ncbi:WD40/YVTN/BNR-like repeat-containing protein, partial [candidate division KSB1 bacterium]
VLYISERTGAVDIVMDPSDSNILYAAAWQLISGEESGIYKTSDGGNNWEKLTSGLPSGKTGRAGLDISVKNPDVVYAFIDNHAPGTGENEIAGGEVYRSDNKGETWRKVNEDDLYGTFTIYGWKFCDIRISPDNEDEIYILGNRGYHSTDGGKTYKRFGERIIRMFDTKGIIMHLDHHEIWIDPDNTDRIILGNDGGLFMSYDRADSWLHINNLPIGEFYTVSTDMDIPYNIYGGTQDNASLYGPGTHDMKNAVTDPWEHVFLDRWTGGDGFVTLRDPTDRDIVYYEHQHGSMYRMDITGSVMTGGPSTTRIRPRAKEGERRWRFGWYMPFIISKYDPYTLYAGGNKLLKSTDRGDNWTAISPDLAYEGKGQWEKVPFGTITMISESPLQKGLLFAGTEGGSIYITRDDGENLNEISAGLPEKWVSRIIASKYDPRIVYSSFTGYREDDFGKYLFMSEDQGETWSPISGNLPPESINVITEDPEYDQILYVGTDLGVYVTLDRGKKWYSLCCNLPTTPVHDMTVHPRDLELIIGTHGRSVFVIDIKPVHRYYEEAKR